GAICHACIPCRRDGLSHQTHCARRAGQSRQAGPERPDVCDHLPRRADGWQPEQEFEVLVLLARGQSVKHIAQSLTLSIKTVSTYRARLLDKLQLSTTAELIRYALDHHLVE